MSKLSHMKRKIISIQVSGSKLVVHVVDFCWQRQHWGGELDLIRVCTLAKMWTQWRALQVSDKQFYVVYYEASIKRWILTEIWHVQLWGLNLLFCDCLECCKCYFNLFWLEWLIWEYNRRDCLRCAHTLAVLKCGNSKLMHISYLLAFLVNIFRH